MLEGRDLRRVVELGTGFGRLSPLLAAMADHSIGVDFDPGHLLAAGRAAAAARPGRAPPTLILANLYHLPFAPGAFTAEVLIRVYHHLSEPGTTLLALQGCLADGGRLILTYNPRPTLGTLTNDVWRAMTRGHGTAYQSITFARGGRVVLPADPFPTYVDTPAAFRRAVSGAGLRITGEHGTGLEEYSRRIPVKVFVSLTTAWRPFAIFSTRFAALEPTSVDRPALRGFDRAFACPRCGSELACPDFARPVPVECPSCRWASRVTEGLNDLRYVPASAAVHSADPGHPSGSGA